LTPGVYIKTDEKGKTKQYKSKKQAKEHGFSEETRLNSVFLSLSIFLLARPICRLRPALSPLKDAVTPKPESIVGNACGSDTVGKAEDLLKMGQGNGDQQLSSFGQSGKVRKNCRVIPEIIVGHPLLFAFQRLYWLPRDTHHLTSFSFHVHAVHVRK